MAERSHLDHDAVRNADVVMGNRTGRAKVLELLAAPFLPVKQ